MPARRSSKASGWQGTPASRGYGSKWRKLRARRLRHDNYLCVACAAAGRDTPATNVDHRIPKARGGTDAFDNLQSLCDDCRARKDREDNGGTYIERPAVGLDGWPDGFS